MLKKRIQKGKEIEILKVCEHCLIDFHVHFEQKADLSVRQECAAQRRFSEAEADMETRKWEKRSSDMAFYEINRELKSQRLELYQAN